MVGQSFTWAKRPTDHTAQAVSKEQFLTPEGVSGVASGEYGSPWVQNEKRQLKAVFIVLSGKRDSSPRGGRFARELCLHPQPLEGATWGRS